MEQDRYPFLRRVCDYNVQVADSWLEYVNRFPENEGIFREMLDELHWSWKFVGKFRNHISLTAVPLATKIYEQLEIITFPFIERVACRGWDTAGGTWAWAMATISDNQRLSDVGSGDPVRYCLRKDVTLSQIGSGEICGERKVR